MDWMLLPFRRYVEFSGRSRRKEYWMFALFVFLANIVAVIIDSLLGYSTDKTGPVNGIFSLATTVPYFAVGLRRLHDVDRSGWWLFSPAFALVPLVIGYALGTDGNVSPVFLILTACVGAGFAILIFVWLVTRGTIGPNRYGPDPMGQSTEEMERIFS